MQLIGNLTRDPELRYTPQGTAVCTLGLATNRQWATDTGEKREETEFHRIVAWNKLAELCSQLLFKGRRVYVEGRLQTRRWTAQDGVERQTTEIVIDEMMILDSRRAPGEEGEVMPVPVGEAPASGSTKAVADDTQIKKGKKKSSVSEKKKVEEKEEEVKAEDIPF